MRNKLNMIMMPVLMFLKLLRNNMFRGKSRRLLGGYILLATILNRRVAKFKKNK